MPKNGDGRHIVLTPDQEREIAELQDPLFYGLTYDEARDLVLTPEQKQNLGSQRRIGLTPEQKAEYQVLRDLGYTHSEARYRVLTPEERKEFSEQTHAARRHRYAKNPYREIIKAAHKGAAHRRRRDGALPKNEFTITENDLYWPTHCPVLGMELHYPGHYRYDPAAPSLDRIDNTKGYVPDNVEVVSLRANSLRKNATKEELRALFTYYNSPWEDFDIEY